MVSFIEGRTTRDGRKRAPTHLFGSNHRKAFPWIRAGIGATLLSVALYISYRRSTYVSPEEKFIHRIKIQPYGVMGTQMSLQSSLRQEGTRPDESMMITDPCDLAELMTVGSTATGTSAAICKWLGGANLTARNNALLQLSKVCDAKYVLYDGTKEGVGEKHVVHVAAPDFREGVWSEREAAIELSRAYRNLLHEYVVSECETLRMVPLSNGTQSGSLYNQMPAITQAALVMAFEQLHIFDKEYVLRDDKKMELCVFMNREWDMYNNAFTSLPVGSNRRM